MFFYALTIFIGAFLLFQIQPLIGKYILPWYGGGPGVWTTCMLFFQLLLLGGYAYAHLSTRLFKPRRQALVHLALVLAALAMSHITPGDSWKPRGDENPTLHILALLTVCLGLPYFVLSSTGPLMQHWFSRTHAGVSPYRLYALSNVGSLLALVSYPFFVETQFTRKTQAWLWAGGFALYAIAAIVCAMKLWRANPANPGSVDEQTGNAPESAPVFAQKILWLLLPACASVLLLAITNKICQDVAVIPFLWVLPLAIYLLSFIICFDNPRWYWRPVFTPALVAAFIGICWALVQGTDASIRAQVGTYSAGLFVCCMVCHGELYRLRPAPRHLTSFYLMIAAGGALGGLFVALGAPVWFTDYYELQIGLLLCGLLFIFVWLREKNSTRPVETRWVAILLTVMLFAAMDQLLVWVAKEYPDVVGNRLSGARISLWIVLVGIFGIWIWRRKFWSLENFRWVAGAWLMLGWLALAAALWRQSLDEGDGVVARSRNFYGTLKVCEYDKEDPDAHYFLLQHGRITHGIQFTSPEFSQLPTTYYADGSGVALGVAALPQTPRRIGVVGLGTGSMAVFGRTNDYVRLYEINPDVQRVATSWFTYLSNSPAKIEVALGDARLSLEREPPQKFDLLALDAFSSDAIPVHLLTKEAFEVYGRHLKSNGVIAVHISNRYLNLEPVIGNLARHFGYHLATIDYDEETDDAAEWWMYSSTWILLSRDQALMVSPAITNAKSPPAESNSRIPLWTDDFASLFQILD